jgi:tripartite-type tricarboxylate transporter receptor subunit TctC
MKVGFSHRAALAGLAVMAACGLLTGLDANAQNVAEFYRGKRVNMVISGSVGGGYDQYARLIAKHMPRHIPGEPTITVQNMVGAEGLRAAEYLFAIAPQDGTVIGGLQRNNGIIRFYEPDNPNIRFDPRAFHWLGSPQQEIGLFIVSVKSGVKTIDDLKSREITASSTARNSPSSIYPRILNAFYGTKIKVIEGYDGSQAGLLAVERGEVDGHVSGGSSAPFRARIEPWLKAGKAQVIMQLGMERDPAYPNAPTALELAPSPDARQIFEIAFVEQVMGRPFVVPPRVPADRVQALRAAFDATMKDPAFLADAEAQKVEIAPVSGETINALLDKVYAAPPDVAGRIRDILK